MVREKQSKIKNQRSGQQGGVSILLITTFLPIFAIWIFILGIRSQAVKELVAQRKLDRCLYPSLLKRCEVLTGLSKSNQVLKLAQTGKLTALAVAILLPGLGTAMGAGTEEALAAATKAVVAYQDFLIAEEKLSFSKTIRCGTPKNPLTAALRFSRRRADGPLTWQNQGTRAYLELISWDFQKKSFGFCRAKERQGSLSGEKYEIDFRVPTKIRDKLSLKALVF